MKLTYTSYTRRHLLIYLNPWSCQNKSKSEVCQPATSPFDICISRVHDTCIELTRNLGTRTHRHILMGIHTNTHRQTHTHGHTYKHTQTDTYSWAYIHTNTHTIDISCQITVRHTQTHRNLDVDKHGQTTDKNRNVTELSKLCIRLMQILSYKFVRMRMQICRSVITFTTLLV